MDVEEVDLVDINYIDFKWVIKGYLNIEFINLK